MAYEDRLIALSRKYINLIKKLRSNIHDLRKEGSKLRHVANSFINLSLNDAKKYRRNFETAYRRVIEESRKIQEKKLRCSVILNELGRLGDEMKHYSNYNKREVFEIESKSRNIEDSAKRKYNRIILLLNEYERKQRELESRAKKVK